MWDSSPSSSTGWRSAWARYSSTACSERRIAPRLPGRPCRVQRMNNTPPMAEAKSYPGELRALLGRAGAGDATALPALRRAFDQNPELVARLGDLAAHAEQALLALAAGDNLAAREAIARQAADLRGELLEAGSSALERLLVERVALCW